MSACSFFVPVVALVFLPLEPVAVTWLEDFNGPFPPPGWSVVDNTGDAVWQRNTDLGRANYTGGDGTAAAIDSDVLNWAFIDAELISPPFIVPDNAYLEFDHSFRWYALPPDERGDVDISVDGAPWATLLAFTGSDDGYPTGTHKTLDLSAVAGQTIQVRFRYYDANWDWWWQIDNVAVTVASPVPALSAVSLWTMAALVLMAGVTVHRRAASRRV